MNDAVTREAITKKQMNSFLKFIHDDNCYCKYYEVIYILFHTGLRVSELEDAVNEMNRMQQLESARKEQEALSGKTDEVKLSKKHFRAG